MSQPGFQSIAKDHAQVHVMAAQWNGNYVDGGTAALAAIEEKAERLRSAIRAARSDGVLSPEAAKGAKRDLRNALDHLDDADHDGFVASMTNVKHLLDGADDLVSLADGVLDDGLRGRP